jgi:DNA-directed RNA polymerase subunit M/transcription elongation factor TFIIS
MTEFNNRSVRIISKHNKSSIIHPLLSSTFQLQLDPFDHPDTDTLGTFTGSIERKLDAIATLRKKCDWGKTSDFDGLIIASEGSFGPSPISPFIQLNEERVMLIDCKNNLEIQGIAVSHETNCSEKIVYNFNELIRFARKIGFPSHKIILIPSPGNHIYIDQDESQLAHYCSIESLFENGLKVMTDMRAMNNPSRQKIIQEATKNLIENMLNKCPKCYHPGFSKQKSIPGLPCKACLLPTKNTKAHSFNCANCTYEEIIPVTLKYGDPTFCDFCNP